MGWKTTTILIRPAHLDGGHDQLLAALGFEKRRKIDDAPFSRAGAGGIWVGATEDCVILETLFALDLLGEQTKRTSTASSSETPCSGASPKP